MASSTASHVTVSPAEAGQYWWHFRVPFSITLCKDFWYTDSQSTILSRNAVTPCYSGKASFAAIAHLLSMITARLFCCHTMLQKWPVVAWKECRIKWDQIYGSEVDGSPGGGPGWVCKTGRRHRLWEVTHWYSPCWPPERTCMKKNVKKRPYSRRWNDFRWGTTSTRGTRLWS